MDVFADCLHSIYFVLFSTWNTWRLYCGWRWSFQNSSSRKRFWNRTSGPNYHPHGSICWHIAVISSLQNLLPQSRFGKIFVSVKYSSLITFIYIDFSAYSLALFLFNLLCCTHCNWICSCCPGRRSYEGMLFNSNYSCRILYLQLGLCPLSVSKRQRDKKYCDEKVEFSCTSASCCHCTKIHSTIKRISLKGSCSYHMNYENLNKSVTIRIEYPIRKRSVFNG